MEFDELYVVLLHKGPQWTDEESERLNTLQAAHIKYLEYLHAEHDSLVAGPFNAPTGNPRGMILLWANGRSLADIKALMVEEPMSKVEHFRVEIIPWFIPKGLINR
jgi:uncharacterized protein YciI